VLFDHYSRQWMVSAAGNPAGLDGTNDSWLLLALSGTENPTGSWRLFGLPVNVGRGHLNVWLDFPALGVDPNNIVVTGLLFTQGVFLRFIHSDVWVLDRLRFLVREPPFLEDVDFKRHHDPGNTSGGVFQPCQTFRQTAETAVNYLVDEGWLDSESGIRRFFRVKRITGAGGSSVLEDLDGKDFIEVGCYNFCVSDAPQPECAARIDVGDTRLLNAVSRDGSIWVTHAVGAGCVAQGACGASVPLARTEVAWYEIDPSRAGAFPGGTPVQQGRVSDPELFFYYPSIAVNRRRCVTLGFSASSANRLPGGWYAVRTPADAEGMLRLPHQLRAGREPYYRTFGGVRNRWGDYSAAVVDPSDDSTFWTVQEYAEVQFEPALPDQCESEQGRWGTHWAVFRCPAAAGDCNDDSLVNVEDHAAFTQCLTGPDGGPLGSTCECVD
jgi:hypothetical protein